MARFTIDLSDEDDEAFRQIVNKMGDLIGRVAATGGPGKRYPSRGDVMRAMLHLAEDNTHAIKNELRGMYGMD